MNMSTIRKLSYPNNLFYYIQHTSRFKESEYIDEIKKLALEPFTDDQMKGLDYVLSTLKEKRRNAIKLRFELGLSLANISSRLEVCTGRAGQIIEMAIINIMKPYNLYYIIRGFENNENFISKKIIDQNISDDPSDVSLYSLKLSQRTINCLKRAGIKNVHDLFKLMITEEGRVKVQEIRNIGKKGYEEILNATTSIFEKDTSVQRKFIDEEWRNVPLSFLNEVDEYYRLNHVTHLRYDVKLNSKVKYLEQNHITTIVDLLHFIDYGNNVKNLRNIKGIGCATFDKFILFLYNCDVFDNIANILLHKRYNWDVLRKAIGKIKYDLTITGDIDLSALELSPLVYRLLKKNYIDTVEELVDIVCNPEYSLYKIRGFNSEHYTEVVQKLYDGEYLKKYDGKSDDLNKVLSSIMS